MAPCSAPRAPLVGSKGGVANFVHMVTTTLFIDGELESMWEEEGTHGY